MAATRLGLLLLPQLIILGHLKGQCDFVYHKELSLLRICDVTY